MARRNRNKNLGPMLVSFTAIFAVIGMIFETVAIVFGYDPNMRVFKLGSKVAPASVAALFILSIAIISIALCVGKVAKMRSKAPNGILAYCISAVGGVSLAISSVFALVDASKKAAAAKAVIANTPNKGSMDALMLFSILLVVIAVPCMLSFIFGMKKNDKLTTFLAFFPPLWNAVCLVRLYFDAENAINDPVRILMQLTLVSVMLALMYELKLRVKGTGKIMFTITASLSTVLACASFMSVMLLCIMWKEGSASEVTMSTGSLLLSLYLLMRIDGYYKMARESY